MGTNVGDFPLLKINFSVQSPDWAHLAINFFGLALDFPVLAADHPPLTVNFLPLAV